LTLLVLLAALALPPQQSNATPETKAPVPPEQVLAWQLEGLTAKELREEVASRGLTECAEQPLLSALAAARADVETVRAVRHAKAPCTVWKLGLQLPTDYLYEIAGAMMWNDWGYALRTMQAETMKQPGNPDVHLIYAHLLAASEDWIAAYGKRRRTEVGAGFAVRARGALDDLLPLAALGVCGGGGDDDGQDAAERCYGVRRVGARKRIAGLRR
jgi:hypothetical protein